MEENNSYYLQKDVHSEELNYILGKPSGKFVKYGIIVSISFMVFLLGTCLLIKYPEIEQGECIIYADPAPRPVVIKTEGKLDTLFVSEGESVIKNQPIGILQNSATYRQVLQLESEINDCLENAKKNDFDKIIITPALFTNIGELQGSFQHLYWNYMQIRIYIKSPFFKHLKNTILAPQKKTASSILSHRTAENQSKHFREFQISFFDLMASFVNAINILHLEIILWNEKYVLTAPVMGKVVFPTVVFKNQEVIAGKYIFYVDPPYKKYYAQMTLSQKSHNKVKIGQPVVINLQANSQNPIKGYVTYISQIIDKEGNFTVKAAFVKGQTDSFGQLTDFRNEQRGSGSIIINRRSLLTKILRLK